MAKRKLPAKRPVTMVTEDSASPSPAPVLTGGPIAIAAKATSQGIREELDAAQTVMMDRYQQGMLTLQIETDRIEDLVGSDRESELGTDDEFEALRLNIEARGQTQPIRVRPARADWEPDAAGRVRPSDKFVLQSGRRRLAVCKLLGRAVLAIVAPPDGKFDAHDDLVERFAENTVRANLTAWERYLSIGQIAEQFSGESQAKIAALINIQRPEVSIGLSVWGLQNDLVAHSGGLVKQMNSHQIRSLVKDVKGWISDGRPQEGAAKRVEAPKELPEVYRAKGVVTTVTATTRGKKMILEFDAGAGGEDVRAVLEEFLAGHYGSA